MKKKILIIGSSGYLGMNLKKNLSKNNKIISSHLRNKKIIDINNYPSFKKIVKINNIDFLINCSGQFSNNIDEFKNTTLKGNRNIIRLATKYNFKVIFCSTTHTYGNKKDEYTKMKLLAEGLYKRSNIAYKILRISNVYDSSFKKKGLLRNLYLFFNDKLKKIELINTDIYRNFIHIDDFSYYISLIIKDWFKYKRKKLLLASENIKIKNLISYFIKRYPLNKFNRNNLKLKKTNESSIFLNDSLFAKKYFKYTKSTYLKKIIKNL